MQAIVVPRLLLRACILPCSSCTYKGYGSAGHRNRDKEPREVSRLSAPLRPTSTVARFDQHAPWQIVQARSRSNKSRALRRGSSAVALLLSATNSGFPGASLAESAMRPTPMGRIHHVTNCTGADASSTSALGPRKRLAAGPEAGQAGHLRRLEPVPSREMLLMTEFMIEILPICNIMHLITSTFGLVRVDGLRLQFGRQFN